MISIDKFPAFNGQPPGVAVRFTYIEPTHEVVEALTKAGITVTSAYRSWAGSKVIPEEVFNLMKEDQIDEYLSLHGEYLLESIGREIYNTQTKKLVEVDE
jgi:hypothetical protein